MAYLGEQQQTDGVRRVRMAVVGRLAHHVREIDALVEHVTRLQHSAFATVQAHIIQTPRVYYLGKNFEIFRRARSILLHFPRCTLQSLSERRSLADQSSSNDNCGERKIVIQSERELTGVLRVNEL